jgi:hypothetical protein
MNPKILFALRAFFLLLFSAYALVFAYLAIMAFQAGLIGNALESLIWGFVGFAFGLGMERLLYR